MMEKKYVNGHYVKMTAEEIADMREEATRVEAEYWATISYDEAVDIEIRKKYSISNELAIQRQKDDKPEEYAAYYAYCEECKALVKEKKGIRL